MVLKNLSTGQQCRNRHRGETYGPGERGGEDETYQRITWKQPSCPLTEEWIHIHNRILLSHKMESI